MNTPQAAKLHNGFYVGWLSIWRDTRVYTASNEYAPLQTLIYSLQTVAGDRVEHNPTCAASIPNGSNLDTNAYCKTCRHRHKNRYCYRLLPELAPDKGNRPKSSNFIVKQAAVVGHEDESDNEHGGVIIADSSRVKETDSMYDTGASHNFVPNKSPFSDIVQCSKLFKFDQAVGRESLTHQGTAKLKIGNITLKLRESIFA